MEEFLGVVLAGGRGTRLGRITDFISKAFVPIIDRPVFQYGVDQLLASRHAKSLVVLTNPQNDGPFRSAGFRTVVQDDALVHDMLSGWRFVRAALKWLGPAVLMPCDNVSDVSVDAVLEALEESQADVAFSLVRVSDRRKLSNMGVYDPSTGKVRYRPTEPASDLGVVAPYALRAGFEPAAGSNDADVFNMARVAVVRHDGYWYDIGDPESLVGCTCALAARTRGES